jgi:hypothetical protein
MVVLNCLSTAAANGTLTPEVVVRTLEKVLKPEQHGRKVVEQLVAQAEGEALALHKSQLGKKGATARHAPHREKREKLLAIWAEGNYSTKNDCAEQECDSLGMLPQTARKALRGVPVPDSWPAKLKSKLKQA